MVQDLKAIKQTYRAHGKLLLTGEYFVLCGAKSIALPLQYGQRMEVTEGKDNGILSWKAFMQEGLWFSCELKLPDFEIVNSSDVEKAEILRDTFRTIQKMNPDFHPTNPLEVNTYIDFNNQWGLGSSSTLIANLASWAKVDPFKLNELVFHGSGFDIACATAEGPIFYRRNQQPEPLDLDYPFLENLYFIYSGAKKSTRNEVRRFLNEGAVTRHQIEQMDQLSEAFAGAQKLNDFQRLIREHEQLVSSLLGSPTVKSQYFHDFNGDVKSLGAWGGDFYLIATPMNDRDVLSYFKEKGLRVVFPWRELVLNAAK
ncbi:GYDIA family GHMP kinase [Mangrovibacterium sp.]|uniref:GYDIA family GHMP kinase n=1 Tax=Mangrovibacterium sp. TaxID=1961364 RepID=UPI003564D97B